MSWLEKNRKILSDIEQNHNFLPNDYWKHGSSSSFASSGSFDSPLVSRRLWTGLKFPLDPSTFRIVDRATTELAIYKILAVEAPELIPTFPRFYGIVTSPDGIPKAILTEDYTKGGRVRLEEGYRPPEQFLEVAEGGFRFGLINGLEHITGETKGKLHIIDLYPASLFEDNDEQIKSAVRKELEKYTIKADLSAFE